MQSIPYHENDLTPVGYNLNPNDFVYSIIQQQLIDNVNGFFEIAPNDTVLILTEEAVWVSKRIAGTFHSKVGVVSIGFGHISTTLDPNWKGPLLISLNNPTSQILKLPANKSFVTLILYRVRTPALKDHDNDPSRTDILKGISNRMLAEEITQQGKKFVAKAQEIISNPNATKEFEDKYLELTMRSEPYILKGLIRSIYVERVEYLKYVLIKTSQLLIAVLIGLIILSKLIYGTTPIKAPILSYLNKNVTNSDLIALCAALFTALQVKNEYKK